MGIDPNQNEKSNVRKTLRMNSDLFINQPHYDEVDSSLLETFEEVEEEETPEYRVIGNTIKRDGKDVDVNSLVNDYHRLQTQLRELDKINATLYKSTQQVDKHFKKTIAQEKAKNTKYTWITVISIFIIITSLSYLWYFKGYHQKKIVEVMTANKEEREKIATLSNKIEENNKKFLENIKEKYELKKQNIIEKFKNDRIKTKKELLAKLELQGTTQTNDKLLKEITDLKKTYQSEEQEKLKILKDQMEKERLVREKQAKKMAQLINKLKEKKQETKKSDKVSTALAKNYDHSQNSLQKMQQEIKQLKKQLTKQKKFKTEEPHETKKPDPVKIMKKFYQQNLIKSATVQGILVSKNSSYKLDIKWKNFLDQGITKLFFEILLPKSLHGNKYLNIINHNACNRQSWHYDKIEKRVFRENSSRINDNILKSQFSYEDYLIVDLENYDYEYIKEIYLRGRKTHLILSKPKKNYHKAIYLKQYYWIDSDIYYPLQIKYFNKQNKLCKIFFIKKMVKVKNNYWRPEVIYMINTITRERSYIHYKNWEIDKKIPDKIFTVNALSR